MIPYPHQVEGAASVVKLLRRYCIAYLAWEERTGKTLTAILAAEEVDVKVVLVITKKKAMDGWLEVLAEFKPKSKFIVSTYHSAYKIRGKVDLVILDESHSYISAFPKPGKIWKELRKICKDLPLIYLSATPYAQGPQMLYHQLQLSSWSPWKLYSNFYNWFRDFGRPYSIKANGRDINQYDRCKKEEVLICVEHLFLSKTRTELDFEHEPTDEKHYIELDEATKDVYNTLIDKSIVELNAGLLVCDTESKLRYALHMLEGGTAKIGTQYIVLANNEKIDFIKQKFGDSENLVIMHNYKAEATKLNAAFKKATILQATSFAEGVDLHKYKHLVIYSQDFSTARHTQRRARQANKNRKEPIHVHFLLVRKGTSEQVYKTVSVNKINFVDSVFERGRI